MKQDEVVQVPYLVWELVDETGKVLRSVEQPQSEYEVNGAGDALALLLPLEHFDSAEEGEWDVNEFVYQYEGKTYLVRGRL